MKIKNSFQTNQQKFDSLQKVLAIFRQLYPSLIPGRVFYSGGSEVILPIQADNLSDIYSYSENHVWDDHNGYITCFKVALLLNQPDDRNLLQKFFQEKVPQICFCILEVGYSKYGKSPNSLKVRVFDGVHLENIISLCKKSISIKNTTVVLEKEFSLPV